MSPTREASGSEGLTFEIRKKKTGSMLFHSLNSKASVTLDDLRSRSYIFVNGVEIGFVYWTKLPTNFKFNSNSPMLYCLMGRRPTMKTPKCYGYQPWPIFQELVMIHIRGFFPKGVK